MKNRLSLIVIVVMVIVLIAAVTVTVLVQNSGYSRESATITDEIATVQKKVDEITAAKDLNNFTPTEVVTTFLVEVKSDSDTKAKLYLDSTIQDMDIKNTLKLGSDLANMTIGESQSTVEGETATVVINLEVGADQVARTFTLEKVEGVWKIKGISAE